MNKKNLNEAITEATRFLNRAIKLRDAVKNNGHDEIYCESVTVAATKRASMDLTRALANLRKRS